MDAYEFLTLLQNIHTSCSKPLKTEVVYITGSRPLLSMLSKFSLGTKELELGNGNEDENLVFYTALSL